MKVINYVMAAAFLFSVIVQANDPDPLGWMALYGAAFLACALAIARRDRWPLPALVGVVALLWALMLAPRALGRVGFGELFQAFEMKDERVEVGREFGGLLIVVAWMAVLAWQAKRARSTRT